MNRRNSYTIKRKKGKWSKIKELAFLKENIIAHRGLYDNEKGIPENSLLAFQEATKKSYPIELDVHIVKDNNIVVFHDDTLQRAAKIQRPIKDITYNELRKIGIFSTNERIPLLQEVLELVNGKVGLLIELKYDVSVGKLENELVKLLDKYQGHFAIQSFQPLSLYWFKNNRPNYIKGQLVTDAFLENTNPLKEFMIKHMLLNPITNPDFISSNITMLTDKKIQTLRKKVPLLGWTVKTKQEYDTYIPYCDNLIGEHFL